MSWNDAVLANPGFDRIQELAGYSPKHLSKLENKPILIATRFLKTEERQVGLMEQGDGYHLVSFLENHDEISNIVAVTCYDDKRQNTIIEPVAIVLVNRESHEDLINSFENSHKMNLEECFLIISLCHSKPFVLQRDKVGGVDPVRDWKELVVSGPVESTVMTTQKKRATKNE